MPLVFGGRIISRILKAASLVTIVLALAFVARVCRAADESGYSLHLVDRGLLRERLASGVVPQSQREAVLEREFRDAGCTVSEEPVTKKSGNVICELHGNTNSTVTVGAHFDFADRGQGVVDDWTGASMLVSLFQALRPEQLKHSYQFIGFTQEEVGLLGSTRHVKEVKKEGGILPEAFVNLECLGLGQPKVWVHRSNPILVQRLLEVAAAMHVPVQGINVDNVGDDDTHPFFSSKVPVISIHSITQQTFSILHSPKDNISAIDETVYYDTYRLAAFYLLYLDRMLPVTGIPQFTK